MFTLNRHIEHKTDDDHYVTSKEATELLKIKSSTLYTYVKRIPIKTIVSPSNKKKRLYSFNDIVGIIEKKKTESARTISNRALHWGTPVLETRISHISDDHLYYRSYSVNYLVKKYNFEQVTSYLWTGEFTQSKTFFNNNIRTLQEKHLDHSAQSIQIYLAQLGMEDLSGQIMNDVPTLGAILIQKIVNGITNNFSNEEIHDKIANYFCPGIKHAPELIKASLIVIADHDLNASSFTARVVASTRANLYQVLIAGLSALTGYKHGGNTLKIELLVKELLIELDIKKNLQEREEEIIIGFGHKLYADTDCRAEILLNLLKEKFGQDTRFNTIKAIERNCIEESGKKANVDFALYAVAYVLGKEADFAFFLFALGRMAGWIAHAIEEYAQNELIRPRSEYIGPEPIM